MLCEHSVASSGFKFVGRVLRLRRNTYLQDNVSFDSLLSRAGLEHLEKGWIVCRTTTTKDDCLTGLAGSYISELE